MILKQPVTKDIYTRRLIKSEFEQKEEASRREVESLRILGCNQEK